MAAAAHMVGIGSAHSSASSSSIPPRPPWQHPSVNHQHQALYDHDRDDVLVAPSPSPSPSPKTPATASPAPRHSHGEERLRRPAPRRAGKQRRRPRPSRKLPTTYISADAASFRRMVHQVTGADDDDALHQLATERILCRPAAPPSSRAAQMTAAATATALLPTLDTSAFLIGSGRAPLAPRLGSAGACHGSAVAVRDPGAVLKPEVAEEACGGGGGGVRGGGEYSCSSGSGGGFPSLESWDDADAIFQDQE